MSFVSRHCSPAVIALTLLASVSSTAAQAQSAPAPVSADDQARTIADLQRQIDELKAIVTALQTAQSAPAAAPPPAMAVPAPLMAQAEPQAAPSAPASVPEGNPSFAAAAAPAPKSKAWYEKLRLRGYTQMRFSQIVSGDADAPAGVSRLRSIHDSAVNADSNFSFRRLRMVIQGDLNDHVSLYFQPDFAAAVSNQSVGERREGTVSLRDMYADVFPFDDKSFRIRLGQSKVPYGWENMQSSSNRLALDRTDAINSAAPGERDLGIVAYYTPPRVQAIWDRLADDGQKLFGNYGAFGFGVFNGQGLNRTETDNDVMLVGLATWPFELDGLGLDGQVLELGGAIMRNTIRPEIRTGGVSPAGLKDDRVGVHAILYPQPFGIQAEWNWGTGPEFVPASGRIEERPLNGGYVQAMAKIDNSPIGPFYPFARWQYYRGGFKGAINAPRLETEELELGFEFNLDPALELTATYGWASRKEADERRLGQAEGQILRIQAQWNY
ncbi:porin [Porphyrobacter sp. TH134]|uniref:porin n=1 Tax=Porphyrobacter sp. TH134 TaxID=2067450 RepID=UPI000C7CB153|nr:porin [Porphyrobacter sp. TH134]PLK25127.1 porin [Porphyrobacter sp. TH134]